MAKIDYRQGYPLTNVLRNEVPKGPWGSVFFPSKNLVNRYPSGFPRVYFPPVIWHECYLNRHLSRLPLEVFFCTSEVMVARLHGLAREQREEGLIIYNLRFSQ